MILVYVWEDGIAAYDSVEALALELTREQIDARDEIVGAAKQATKHPNVIVYIDEEWHQSVCAMEVITMEQLARARTHEIQEDKDG